MGLFSSKKEVRLEDFCRDFYETQILNSKIGDVGVDGMAMFAEVVRKNIAEVDSSFAGIDLKKLTEELTIVRFELFGLGWFHKFGVDSAINQSIFTKNYLSDKGRVDIWENMESYNLAVSRSVTTGLSKVDQAYILRGRADIADEKIAILEEMGWEADESLGRPINRALSEKACKNGNIFKGLAFALMKRLAIDTDKASQGLITHLSFVLRGLYEGAQQSFDDIKVIT